MSKKNIKDLKKIEVENNKNTTKKTPKSKQIESEAPDPTRYGDWEKGGRCIDF